jgi:hypothetical protein
MKEKKRSKKFIVNGNTFIINSILHIEDKKAIQKDKSTSIKIECKNLDFENLREFFYFVNQLADEAENLQKIEQGLK